jgi:hypothetical protein
MRKTSLLKFAHHRDASARLERQAIRIKNVYRRHIDRSTEERTGSNLIEESLDTGKNDENKRPAAKMRASDRVSEKDCPFLTKSYSSGAWGKTLAQPRQNVVRISDGAYENF